MWISNVEVVERLNRKNFRILEVRMLGAIVDNTILQRCEELAKELYVFGLFLSPYYETPYWGEWKEQK